MGQQHINLGSTATGSDGDTNKSAWTKAEANFTELYGLSGGAQSRRNLLLNADGRVNQRGFAGGNLAANTYGYDMWRALGTATSFTLGTTSSLNGTICQVINGPALQNATVVVSVTNPSAPITVKLQPDATTATSANGIIPAGAGLQSCVIAVPATLTGNVFVLLSTAGATTFNGTSTRSGIQLELGSVANVFDWPMLVSEEMFCRRYYQRLNGFGMPGFALSATTILFSGKFFTSMRASPAVTLLKTSFAAGSFDVNVGGSWATAATASLVGPSPTPNSIDFQLSGFSGLTSNAFAFINTSSDILALDAGF